MNTCKIETADEKTNETTEEIQAKVDEHTQNLLKKLVQQWNRHLLLNKINLCNNGRFSPVVFKLASEHDIHLSQSWGR